MQKLKEAYEYINKDTKFSEVFETEVFKENLFLTWHTLYIPGSHFVYDYNLLNGDDFRHYSYKFDKKSHIAYPSREYRIRPCEAIVLDDFCISLRFYKKSTRIDIDYTSGIPVHITARLDDINSIESSIDKLNLALSEKLSFKTTEEELDWAKDYIINNFLYSDILPHKYFGQ